MIEHWTHNIKIVGLNPDTSSCSLNEARAASKSQAQRFPRTPRKTFKICTVDVDESGLLMMANLHPSPFLAGAQAVFKAQGREDVHRRRDHLRRLLAALPRLLHLHLPPQGDRAQALHPARLPRLLLAGHGQLNVQPAGLLLDERKVLQFYIFLAVYVLRSCSCILTDSCCDYNYMPGWLVGSAGAGLLHAQFPPLYTLVAGEGGPVTYPTTSRGLLGLVASPPPPVLFLLEEVLKGFPSLLFSATRGD